MAPVVHDSAPDALINAKFSDMLIPDIYTYTYDLSHLSPIDRLPVELLIDIFVTCARDFDGAALGPLTLSHVCRTWRDIVFDSPRVWQFLSLDDTRPHRSTDYQSLLWLRQSRSLPLDVRIDVSNLDLVLPLLIPLLPHIHRWRRWNFTGKITEDVDFRTFSKDGSRAIFDDLQITIRGISELQDLHQVLEGDNRHTIFTHTQSYLKPDVHMINIRLNVLTLPPSTLMSALLVRNLTISESTLEMVSDPIRMLEFLQFCPSIETFHYFGFPQEPPSYPELPARPPMIDLPCLRVLVVRSTCAVRVILSHITTPFLNELYLEHTNMEFEPDVAAYPYDPEDGDSDDENQDFSQSPWSDHATGMGLRSLIRRCNPPLEVLAMDYADMRTKDFEWCFARMPSLQEFRIVASDMSDKVIAMLAPYRDTPSPCVCEDTPSSPHHRHSSDDGDMFSSSDSDTSEDVLLPYAYRTAAVAAPATTNLVTTQQPLHVRMPRLTSLELWNCQRLSGDAVVHALRSRARYTDQVAEGGDMGFLKLEDVAVIGCHDFLPRHAVDLGITLGNRLRIN